MKRVKPKQWRVQQHQGGPYGPLLAYFVTTVEADARHEFNRWALPRGGYVELQERQGKTWKLLAERSRHHENWAVERSFERSFGR